MLLVLICFSISVTNKQAAETLSAWAWFSFQGEQRGIGEIVTFGSGPAVTSWSMQKGKASIGDLAVWRLGCMQRNLFR